MMCHASDVRELMAIPGYAAFVFSRPWCSPMLVKVDGYKMNSFDKSSIKYVLVDLSDETHKPYGSGSNNPVAVKTQRIKALQPVSLLKSE